MWHRINKTLIAWSTHVNAPVPVQLRWWTDGFVLPRVFYLRTRLLWSGVWLDQRDASVG